MKQSATSTCTRSEQRLWTTRGRQWWGGWRVGEVRRSEDGRTYSAPRPAVLMCKVWCVQLLVSGNPSLRGRSRSAEYRPSIV